MHMLLQLQIVLFQANQSPCFHVFLPIAQGGSQLASVAVRGGGKQRSPAGARSGEAEHAQGELDALEEKLREEVRGLRAVALAYLGPVIGNVCMF